MILEINNIRTLILLGSQDVFPSYKFISRVIAPRLS